MHFRTFYGLYHRLLLFLPFVSEYNYDNPHEWPSDFETCNGFFQSPISIYVHKTIPISLPALLFELYDEPLNECLTLKNNGHTIEFEIPKTIFGSTPYITGGFLPDIFAAEKVHFHWGSPNQKGSEHALNGRRYDLEMHIVHKNTKYSSILEARQFEDGLSVIAVLFKAVKFEDFNYHGLNTLYKILDEIRDFNATAQTIDVISLGSLLGDINRQNFMTYRGSMTTPPCSESVTWYIFPEILPISYSELSKFWSIMDKRRRPLHNTFRPLQELQYRKVYRQTTVIWAENLISSPADNLYESSEEWD